MRKEYTVTVAECGLTNEYKYGSTLPQKYDQRSQPYWISKYFPLLNHPAQVAQCVAHWAAEVKSRGSNTGWDMFCIMFGMNEIGG